MKIAGNVNNILKASPRLKARIAGVLYVTSIVIGILGEFVVRGRLGYAVGLIAIACNFAATLAVYVIFRPVNRSLCLLALCFNLIGEAFEVFRWNPPGMNIAIGCHGLYCLLIGFLILRSTIVPRILGVLMAFAGLVWLTSLSTPLANRLAPYNLVGGLLGEASLMLWLLVMAVNVQRSRETASMRSC